MSISTGPRMELVTRRTHRQYAEAKYGAGYQDYHLVMDAVKACADDCAAFKAAPATAEILRKARSRISLLRDHAYVLPKEFRDRLSAKPVDSDDAPLESLEDHIVIFAEWMVGRIEEENAELAASEAPRNRQRTTPVRITLLLAGLLLIALYFSFSSRPSLARMIAGASAWACLVFLVPAKWLRRWT